MTTTVTTVIQSVTIEMDAETARVLFKLTGQISGRDFDGDPRGRMDDLRASLRVAGIDDPTGEHAILVSGSVAMSLRKVS